MDLLNTPISLLIAGVTLALKAISLLTLLVYFYIARSFLSRKARSFLWRKLKSAMLRRGVENEIVTAFFHPYCNSGGGGERVLWICVYALLTNDVSPATLYANDNTVKSRKTQIVIYTGDNDRTKQQILANVESRFAIKFTERQAASISFVYIQTRFLLEPRWYPVATMLWQSIGSIIVGIECMVRLVPDVYIDTTGAAFTYPVVKAVTGGECLVMAYVHYPIISSDMLQKVREQRPSYNNTGRIASSITVSSLKLVYYKLFARAYGCAGWFANSVVVNSTWTKRHIETLWGIQKHTEDDKIPLSRCDGTQSISTTQGSKSPGKIERKTILNLIYPPCNTEHLLKIPMTTGQSSSSSSSLSSSSSSSLSSSSSSSSPAAASYSSSPYNSTSHNKRYILSIGQFRPEKDHRLQIRALKELTNRGLHDQRYSNVVLVIIGSTRNAEDEQMVRDLQQFVASPDIALPVESVQFVVNQAHAVVEEWMQKSLVGLHTMWNEHFGISVVEMQAAGLVVLAHKSGGPLSDIITPPAGTRTTDSSAGSAGPADSATLLPNGFLAGSVDEYADHLVTILDDYDSWQGLRDCARESAGQFSDGRFCDKMREAYREMLA
jgi:alpha-1,2-mannosyltransferase